MSIATVAHLNFRGRARAALEFYATVFGGHAHVVTYGDFGMPAELPDASKVVFGSVTAASGFSVMAYDIPGTSGDVASDTAPSTRRENGVTLTSEPFFLSMRGDSVEEVAALWAKLAVDATDVEPFGPSPWAPGFGMLTDRFGVTWILDVATSHEG